MERKEIESAVEAILFASGEAVQLKRLCAALQLARPAVERALKDLGDHYAFERRGIRLVQMEDSWQLCSEGVCGPDPGGGQLLHHESAVKPGPD